MKLIIGNRCFHPKLITSLLALLFLYLFVSLGLWQLDRAEYKRKIYVEFENRQSSGEMVFDSKKSIQLEQEDLIWRNVKAEGVFLEEYQILLDNQVEDTHAGYFVYTPFKFDQSNTIVLINRGWVLADANRKVTPDLTFTNRIVEINGVIKETPKTGLLLKEMPPEKMDENTYRVQRINIKELEILTNEKLLPYVIRLEPKSEHGYIRNWRLPGSDEDMHKGYAFQWFAFATVLFFIYLVLNIKKINKMEKEE